jgi:hypothetical protein
VTASTTVLALLAIAAWIATGILVTRAIRRPRIGALTERAFLSVLLALFGSVCVVLLYNRETGYSIIPIDVARGAFSGLLFLLLLVSPAWLLLLATDRLGGRQ